MAEGEAPTEEELLATLDRIGVADVLVQALATTASIGFRRVSAEARDLAQARLAIEALRALDPVLREAGTDEAPRPRSRAGADEPPARLRESDRGRRCGVIRRPGSGFSLTLRGGL